MKRMHRTKSGVWFFVGMGFLTAQLWNLLRVVDWIVLAMLISAPAVGVWRHFREVEEVTEKAYVRALQVAIGGYVPLWWGLGLAGRMLNR